MLKSSGAASFLALLLTLLSGGDEVKPRVVPPSETSRTIIGSVQDKVVIAAVDREGAVLSLFMSARKTPAPNGDFKFRLDDIPSEEPVRLYVIRGGETYPLYYDSSGSGAPNTNAFVLAQKEITIDLGNLEVSREFSTPSISPNTFQGVSSRAEIPLFPEIQPDTTEQSFSRLSELGLDALESYWVVGADAYFAKAISLINPSTPRNEADFVRFLYALTKSVRWGIETPTDLAPADLNRLSDLLDQVGVNRGISRANSSAFELPRNLPDNSPRLGRYQEFLYQRARGDLIEATSYLDQISSSFVKLSRSAFGSGQTEYDFGDVLLARSTIKGIGAGIELQQAYNLDLDVDEFKKARPSVEQFLASYPDFSSLKAGKLQFLARSKALYISSLTDLDDAIDHISSEDDFQSDDFLTIETSKVNDAKQWAETALLAFSDGSYVYMSNEGSATVDLAKIFDEGALDFRRPSRLIPRYDENNLPLPGDFADASLNGVLTYDGIDPNQDIDPRNGVPDILDPQ